MIETLLWIFLFSVVICAILERYMINDTITTERVSLRRDEIEYAQMIDNNIMINTEEHRHMDYIRGVTIVAFRKWFYTRNLKDDYTFSHPSTLWDLFLHFVFGKWGWFRERYIKYTHHKISIRECYLNLTMPKENPLIILDRIRNISNKEFGR